MDRPQLTESAMSDRLSTFAKNESYVFRMPTPPRIIIPPMGAWAQGEDTGVGSIISHADPAINIDFLDTDSLSSDIVASNRITSTWKYEDRRQAQSILPFLWLGPLLAAKDKEFLRREGITMVIAVHQSPLGARLSTGAMRVANELGLVSTAVEAAQNQDLISVFPTATQLINSHLRELHNRATLNPAGGIPQGKVLLFCESGNEKSAAVAAAYLMDNFDRVDFVKACQICNTRRFCCSFDDGVKHTLMTYNEIILARRGVALSSPPAHTSHSNIVTNPMFGGPTGTSAQVNAVPAAVMANGNTKRARELDDSDDEMDMGGGGDADDVERFTGRTLAPFR